MDEISDFLMNFMINIRGFVMIDTRGNNVCKNDFAAI